MTTLDAAVADLVRHYRERNPESERQLQRATQVLPGGNTRSVLFQEPFPLTMVRGEGCWLWDADGHRNAGAGQQQAEHHPGRPAAGDAAGGGEPLCGCPGGCRVEGLHGL